MKKDKILFLMPHAPYYREPFLRILSKKYHLTVSARSCKTMNLIEPKAHRGYIYYEPKEIKILSKFRIFILPKEIPLYLNNHYDLVICVLGLRYPLRILLFFINKFRKKKAPWIWYGHFFGRKGKRFLNPFIKFLVSQSSGALTYTKEYRDKLINIGCPKDKIASFNNSEVLDKDVNQVPIDRIKNFVHVLFIGSYRKHKKIERLTRLSNRLDFIKVRLIGPGLEILKSNENKNIEIIPSPLTDESLMPHLKWSHIVAAPGHVGLLVSTAARAGRPIVIDSSSKHAPEYLIAKEAEQPFINWSRSREVDSFFESVYKGEINLNRLGERLSNHVKKNYTVENMADIFVNKIDFVLSK